MSLVKDTSDKLMSLDSNIVDESLAPDALYFHYLPQFAQYIQTNHLSEFASVMLQASREIDLPLLRFFTAMPEEEFLRLSLQGTNEFLTFLAENRISEFIDESVKKWVENQLPLVQNNDIVARDISGVGFIRRKGFRQFLPTYTSDINVYNHILDEIDQFILVLEETCFKTLFNLKQQKINENHYFIEKINNTSPGIIYVFDLLEKKEIYSNHKREKLLGFNHEEIMEMGSHLHRLLLHPDDLPQMILHLESFSTANDGEIRAIEYRIKDKKGNYCWHRTYETVFKRTEEGIPSQIIGISLDISMEKEASMQLQFREQQLNEAQELAELGSFEWDMVGENTTMSPQLSKIFEMEKTGGLLSFMEYVHPADRTKVNEAIQRAIAGDGLYEAEYRYQKNTEKIIWSRGVVSFENGKPIKMRGTVMDVTQRHQIHQQLEHTIELHKQAQALTHIGNWSWDINANTISWSDEMYRIYGLEPQSEDIHFERFISLVHPEDRERRLGEIQRALETLHAEDYVMRVVWDNGVTRVLQGKGEVLLDEYNKPYKLVGTCQDVTQQYNINQQLEQKNIELLRSNEELTSFNYIASHDLQEPLRKIKLFGNRIFEKDYDTLPNTAREFLPRIINSANQMQKLLNDLLAFSRATSAFKVFERINLNELLEEVKTSIKDTIEEKKVTINATDLPTLHLIPFQFQQLLENLISNAIKYCKTETCPEINISSTKVMGRQLGIENAIPNKNYYLIKIADNGIGFEQQYAQKIFDLFQRLHSKHEYSGTGIGLAICKKIVQNHDGFITAEGLPDKGSTFTIVIPVK